MALGEIYLNVLAGKEFKNTQQHSELIKLKEELGRQVNIKSENSNKENFEALFDYFIEENRLNGKNIKSIVKTDSNSTNTIKNHFRDFLNQAIKGEIYIENTLIKNTINAIKKENENNNISSSIENQIASLQIQMDLESLLNEISTNSGGLYVPEIKTPSNVIQAGLGSFVIPDQFKGSTNNKVQENIDKASNQTQTTKNIDASNNTNNIDNNISKITVNRINRNDFIDSYPQNEPYIANAKVGLIGATEVSVANIYRDNWKTKKILNNIFDDEYIRSKDLNLNLESDKGLVDIISKIENKSKEKGITIEKDDTIRVILEKLGFIDQDAEIKTNDIPTILDKLGVSYDKKGIFRDNRKLKNIFTYSKREYLSALQSIVKSRPNTARAIRERHNNKTIVEKGFVDANNLFDFLSDINGDGIVSADKKNKNQFKIGDLANISGQQLLFTLNQAVNTQNTILGGNKGESLVVNNIAKMILMMVGEKSDYLNEYGDIFGNYNNTQKKEFQKSLTDLSKNPNATKQELLDNIIGKYTESKTLFLAAVEKITGGSDTNQTDLYDSLTGQYGKKFQQINSFKEQEQIRNQIDGLLKRQKLEGHNLEGFGDEIELRETIFQKTIDLADKLSLQLVFDKATKDDMIMSGASKTYYRGQARKTILENMNIENIHLTGNSEGIKIGYKIGKTDISGDGRTKLNIIGGPSFYVGNNSLAAGGDIRLNKSWQTNYLKASNASLSKVQDAKYIGAEGGAGVSISIDGDRGTGLYAMLGISKEKDLTMGINQLSKTYEYISNLIFDLGGEILTKATDIQNRLNGNLNDLKANDRYKTFIKNNENKLKENIRFSVEVLEQSGLLEEIRQIPEVQRQIALQSLVRMIQQGNIDQRLSDILMNLHGKVDITRISMGLSAGTQLALSKAKTKNRTNTGTQRSGEGEGLASSEDEQIINEDGSSTGINTPKGFLGLYMSARISAWKNTYFANQNQFLQIDQDMQKGGIDQINMGNKLNKYAEYLNALYNKDGLKISIPQNEPKKILIEYTGDGKLHEILNIHYNTNSRENFIYQGNKLLIGDVGEISAYTTTMPSGVRRMLILGSKSIKNTNRLTTTNNRTVIKDIEFTQNGYEFFDKTKIDNMINSLNIADTDAKNTYKSLFGPNGKLINQNNVSFTDRLTHGQSFSTGTLTLYKKSDGKYILDYNDSRPENQLKLEYKSLGAYQEIEKIEKIDLKEESVKNFPDRRLDAKNEYNANGKISQYFAPFMTAVVNGNIANAINNLKGMEKISTEHKNILENGTKEEKAYLAQRYTSLFAYEDVYKGKDISNNIFRRGNHFLTLKGPNRYGEFSRDLKNILPQYKKKFLVINKHKKHENIGTETPKNVFGYTAFYRNLKNGEIDNKGYASTRLGETNIAKGSKNIIGEGSYNKDTLQDEAKRRIADNLKKDPAQKVQLKKQINKLLKDKKQSIEIGDNDLYNLLIGEELEITNSNQNLLDISNKKLKLNANAIFYLLRECINESIGLEITDITVKDNLETLEKTESSVPKYNSILSAESNSVSGYVKTKQSNIGFRAHKKINNRPKKNKEIEEQHIEEGEQYIGEGESIVENEFPEIIGE